MQCRKCPKVALYLRNKVPYCKFHMELAIRMPIVRRIQRIVEVEWERKYNRSRTSLKWTCKFGKGNQERRS